MADDDEEYDDDEEEYDEDDEGGGGSKKLLIIVGLALFLVVGGAVAAYFTGLLQPVIDMISGGEEAPAEGTENDADVTSGESYFKPMEDLIVNLNTGGKKSVFLNMKVSLELSSQADGDKVELLMPRVIDYFQVYLRELRVEDLKGSAGMYRLREELLARVRVAVAPIRVRDVLFKQILIQ
jgi:flagellar protein FliL